MSGDWQVGDMALCIDDSIGSVTLKCLDRGKVYTVEALDIDPAFAAVGLHLVGVPRPWSDHWQLEIGWSEQRFRKITPDAADEFDREVIAEMTGQPEQVPA